MPGVDRAVLRLGVYELLWRSDVPDAVAIDEAVELAKLLSTDDSPRFVNGVLARVLRDQPAVESDARLSAPGARRRNPSLDRGRLGRQLDDHISAMHGAGDDDAGIQSAQAQLATDARVDEAPRVLTEPGRELGTTRCGCSVTSMTAEPSASRVPGGRLTGLRSRST